MIQEWIMSFFGNEIGFFLCCYFGLLLIIALAGTIVYLGFKNER